MANSDVEDDSPVEYPKVPQYTEWHAWNGKLILVKGRREIAGVVFNEKTTYDTLSFVYMKGDSLALADSKAISPAIIAAPMPAALMPSTCRCPKAEQQVEAGAEVIKN